MSEFGPESSLMLKLERHLALTLSAGQQQHDTFMYQMQMPRLLMGLMGLAQGTYQRRQSCPQTS